MSFNELYEPEITARQAYWQFQFKCVAFPFILPVIRNLSSECCEYLRVLAEAEGNPYINDYNRFCGTLPEPPNTFPDKDFDWREEPDNPVVDPPKKVIPDPVTDIPDDENPPPNTNIPILPPRSLPNPVSNEPAPIVSPTGESFSSTLCETLSNREYGCLLHDPFVNGDYNYCVYGEEPGDFWDQLLEKSRQLAEQIIDLVLDDVIDKVCNLAVMRMPMPFYAKTLLIFGCSQIDEIAEYFATRNKNIRNFQVGGHVFLGQTNVTQCQDPPMDQTPSVEENMNVDCSDNECFIPISSFSKDNQYFHGKRRVLQVVWKIQGWSKTNDYRKDMQIPSVLDGVKGSDVIPLLPTWLYFGHSRYEVDIEPYGKIRYYGVSSDNNIVETDVEDWFEQLVDTLVRKDDGSNGAIKTDSFRQSNKDRPYLKGWFYPWRFYVFDWDDTEQRYICKNKVWINNTQPTTNPPTLTNGVWRQL